MLRITNRAARELKKGAREAGLPADAAVRLIPGEDVRVALAAGHVMPQDEVVYQEDDFRVAVDSGLKKPLAASVLDAEALPEPGEGYRFVLLPG